MPVMLNLWNANLYRAAKELEWIKKGQNMKNKLQSNFQLTGDFETDIIIFE